jgi:hypothetical protein
MELPEFLKKLGIDEYTDPNNPNTWSDTLKSKHASHLEVLKESNPEAYVNVAASKTPLTESTTPEVTGPATPTKESIVEEPVTVEKSTAEEPITDTPTSPTFGGSNPFWAKDDPNWTPPTSDKPKKDFKSTLRKTSIRKDLFDSAPTSTFKITMDNGQPIEEFPSDIESFERKFPTSPRTPMSSASARFKNMQDAIILSQMAEGNRQSTEKKD